MMPVIQPSVPISVVASGIMMRIMKNMNGRPSDLRVRAERRATIATPMPMKTHLAAVVGSGVVDRRCREEVHELQDDQEADDQRAEDAELREHLAVGDAGRDALLHRELAAACSMTKKTTAGTAMMPTLMLHGTRCDRSMTIVIMPASTSPPGQPACRMFSHFVLSRLNIVATTGLMNASTVPLRQAEDQRAPVQQVDTPSSLSPPCET